MSGRASGRALALRRRRNEIPTTAAPSARTRFVVPSSTSSFGRPQILVPAGHEDLGREQRAERRHRRRECRLRPRKANARLPASAAGNASWTAFLDATVKFFAASPLISTFARHVSRGRRKGVVMANDLRFQRRPMTTSTDVTGSDRPSGFRTRRGLTSTGRPARTSADTRSTRKLATGRDGRGLARQAQGRARVREADRHQDDAAAAGRAPRARRDVHQRGVAAPRRSATRTSSHVFDFGQLEGRYFIAMEYVPGVTLRFAHKRMLARGERLPMAATLHVMSGRLRGAARRPRSRRRERRRSASSTATSAPTTSSSRPAARRS